MKNVALTHMQRGDVLDGREVSHVRHERNRDFLAPEGFDTGSSHIGFVVYADGSEQGPERLSRRVMVERVGP